MEKSEEQHEDKILNFGGLYIYFLVSEISGVPISYIENGYDAAKSSSFTPVFGVGYSFASSGKRSFYDLELEYGYGGFSDWRVNKRRLHFIFLMFNFGYLFEPKYGLAIYGKLGTGLIIQSEFEKEYFGRGYEFLEKMESPLILGFGLKCSPFKHIVLRFELNHSLEGGGGTWEALIDGRYGHAQKVHSGIREWLYTRKERDDEDVRAPQLANEVKEKFGVEVDPGHINYLLRKRGLTAPPGRPYKKEPAEEETTKAATAPSESIDNAGVFFPGGSEDGNGGGESD